MPATTHHTSPMIFNSSLGWFGLLGTQLGLRYLTFGHRNKSLVQHALLPFLDDPDLAEESTWQMQAQRILLRYASGKKVDLNQIPIDKGQLTEFQQAVLHCVCAIEYGATISYGELAEQAGSPRAARAVGTFMSQNTIPLVIPCHRVVASTGKLGGYSAPDGLSMKQRLLDLESH